MARGCGAKHIFKRKCTKHHNHGAIFEVLIRKNGTPLWREAHFQVKMHKHHNRGAIFGAHPEKWYSTVARSTFASQNVQNTSLRERFWQFGSQKMARRFGAKRICQSKCYRTEGFGPLLDVPRFKNGTQSVRN